MTAPRLTIADSLAVATVAEGSEIGAAARRLKGRSPHPVDLLDPCLKVVQCRCDSC